MNDLIDMIFARFAKKEMETGRDGLDLPCPGPDLASSCVGMTGPELRRRREVAERAVNGPHREDLGRGPSMAPDLMHSIKRQKEGLISLFQDLNPRSHG
jgi:hypothetical protein